MEVKRFKKFEEVVSFFRKQKEADEWIEVSANAIRALALPDNPLELTLSHTYDDMELDFRLTLAEEEDKLNAIRGTRLMMSFIAPGKSTTLPLRDCGIQTILDNTGTNCSAIRKFDQSKQAEILNWCFTMEKEKIHKVLLRKDNEKKRYEVFAFHSDKYKILPVHDLLLMLEDYLSKNNGTFNVLSAEYTDTRTVIRFVLEDETLIAGIKRALNKRFSAGAMGKPELVFSTSDVSKSGANLFPYINIKASDYSLNMRIGDPLYLKHSGSTSLENFKENLDNIYSMFSKANEQLKKLMDIEIKYPAWCFRNAAAKAKLPESIVEDFITNVITPGDYTAYDIYFLLWRIVPNMKEDKPLESQFKVEEMICRLLKTDFSSFDVPLKK